MATDSKCYLKRVLGLPYCAAYADVYICMQGCIAAALQHTRPDPAQQGKQPYTPPHQYESKRYIQAIFMARDLHHPWTLVSPWLTIMEQQMQQG